MSANWVVLFAVAFVGWRTWKRRGRAVSAAPPSSAPVVRSQRIGDEGEARVRAELRDALTWLCGENFYLHPSAVVLNHAPGTDFPTAEIDHLVITPFGIFIVETKNWTGRIELGPSDVTLTRTGADGRPEIRTSPVGQNRSKVSFLKAVLPPLWPIEGLGVFANERCALSPELPENIIRCADLRQWLRTKHADHAKRKSIVVDVAKAWDAIQSVAETSDIALRKHHERTTASPKKLPAFS